MVYSRITTLSRDISEKSAAFFDKPLIPFNFFLSIILLAYGYEIFGFHLTIDEELHADYIGAIAGWSSQGRWGMSILSAFMPSSVVPVVSPMFGIGLSTFSWWFILTNVFRIGRLEAVFAVGLAVSLPILTFTFTFTTLAYGIGIGNVCLAIFAFHLKKGKLRGLIISSFAGAFAVSIYQTFLFAIFAIYLFEVYRSEPISLVRTSRSFVLSLLGVLSIYVSIDWLVRLALNTNLEYVGGFVDIRGLLNHPVERFLSALMNVLDVYVLPAKKFGLHSPWLQVAMLLSLLVCFRQALTSSWRVSFIRLGAILGIILIPVFADAVSSGGAPLRSGIYFPILTFLLVGFSIAASSPVLRIAVIFSIGAAILGNSAINNRLFSASDFAYQLDKTLAHDIFLEVSKFPSYTLANVQPMKVVLVGSKAWPETKLMPKSETFGASFFEWDGGNRYRVATFLRLSGLYVVAATPEESAKVTHTAASMPVWPNPGWVVLDQGMLILKFGDYTWAQELALCRSGVTSMCH
jgi:hypothetical protein